MRHAVDKAHNTANLRDISALLTGVEHFIFFGTLLGYAREGGIIAGDDDIDIYVNKSERSRVEAALVGTDFTVAYGRPRNRTPHFLQAVRMQGDIQTFLDFYFYDSRATDAFVTDAWNFSGDWKNPENTIHIPKDIVLPHRTAKFEDFEVQIPADPQACCAYLYGPDWTKPLSKGSQYKVIIENNCPKLIAL